MGDIARSVRGIVCLEGLIITRCFSDLSTSSYCENAVQPPL